MDNLVDIARQLEQLAREIDEYNANPDNQSIEQTDYLSERKDELFRKYYRANN